MERLINWTAKRAGDSITLNGVDIDTNQPVKVVGVEKIEADVQNGIVATTKAGTIYRLN